MHEEACTCIANLQCKFEWLLYRPIFSFGGAETFLVYWVISSNLDNLQKFQEASSVVSRMIWCAMCSYHSSFDEDCTRRNNFPCDLPFPNQFSDLVIHVCSISQLICAKDCGKVIAGLTESCFTNGV